MALILGMEDLRGGMGGQRRLGTMGTSGPMGQWANGTSGPVRTPGIKAGKIGFNGRHLGISGCFSFI